MTALTVLLGTAMAGESLIIDPPPAEGIQCGVASAVFQSNPATVATAQATGSLAFWWNWNDVTSLDYSALTPSQAALANASFVPMLWGQAIPPNYDFLKDRSGEVMGYNEPDLYGPACCNCDGKQTYAPATSSGWLPLFNPASAVNFWQTTVNNMTNTNKAGSSLKRIVSPSMANDATPDANLDCTADPAGPTNPKRCNGWLKMFKENALALKCTDVNGAETNCWDVISVIQIHAYAPDPKDVLSKILDYKTVFAEDFAGSNGRTKKTLWLTEVAAASNNVDAVSKFAAGLMSKTGGLADRDAFGFVERVSWFSEFAFGSFNTSGYVPAPNEQWASSLFNPFGGLSPVGEAFFANCAKVSA